MAAFGLSNARTNIGYGRGEHTIAEDPSVDAEALVAKIRDTIESPKYNPPTLPTVAMELLELSRRRDVQVEAIVKLLERDVLLAGKVLKISRSPVYSGTMQVASLKGAVVRLGLSTVRDIVLEAAMSMRIFRAASFSETMELLKNHSVATAYYCRMVARHVSIDPELAFLCGLLHDVGFAAALLILGDAGGAKGKQLALTLELWSALERIHEEIAKSVLSLWKMPEDVSTIVTHHHKFTINGVVHPMLALVRMGESLASDNGFAVEPQFSKTKNALMVRMDPIEISRPADFDLAARHLQLNQGHIEKVRAEAKELAEHLHAQAKSK